MESELYPGIDARMMPFEPLGNIRELFLARDKEIRLAGPAGTGKTRAALELVFIRATDHPGARILLARASRKSMSNSTLATFEKHVIPSAFRGKKVNRRYREQYVFPNNSEIDICGLDDVEKIQSAEYDLIVVDEATQTSESDWEYLLSRLRNYKIPWQQAIALCNPDAPTHWLNVRGMRRIDTTHSDNPYVVAHPDYVTDTLGKLTGYRRQRLLHGLWCASEGLVYEDYEKLFVDAMVKPPEHIMVGGIDFGYTDPQAQLYGWLYWPDGHKQPPHLYIEDTYKHAKRVIATNASWLPKETVWFCDPARPDDIVALRMLGHDARKANNNVAYGINIVLQMIEAGRLKINNKCKYIMDEFAGYAYDPVRPEKVIKTNDHILDALRYLATGVVYGRPTSQTKRVAIYG